MNPITWGKKKVRGRLSKFVRTEVQKTMADMFPQLIEFQNSPNEKRQSYHDHTRDPLGNSALYSSLKDRLLEAGIPVTEIDIDVSDFERWMNDFPEVTKYYQETGDVFIEKCLEHHLAAKHLNISNGDVYIDIAASGSPWADILNKRGIKSYSLDLAHKNGMHGIKIGADAGDTRLPEAFATVLSSQCAYECFMGEADIRFVREADRILKKGGRYGILPLYLDDTYFVAISPYCNQENIVVESEARRVWRDDEHNTAFSRHYSPESFRNRIFSAVPETMTGKVLYFRNLTEVMKRYPGQRIYCFFMFYCEKKSTI